MPESCDERIVAAMNAVARWYFRLVVLAAPAGAGKTTILRRVAAMVGAPLVNVNLELSGRLLELTAKQRKIHAAKLLDDIVAASKAEVVLLDNIEVLFDPTLEQDPLGLLQRLSRNRAVVAAWSGEVEDGSLTYAAPEHAEYKRYPVRDFLLVTP